jgi:hypothetical protein
MGPYYTIGNTYVAIVPVNTVIAIRKYRAVFDSVITGAININPITRILRYNTVAYIYTTAAGGDNYAIVGIADYPAAANLYQSRMAGYII